MNDITLLMTFIIFLFLLWLAYDLHLFDNLDEYIHDHPLIGFIVIVVCIFIAGWEW